MLALFALVALVFCLAIHERYDVIYVTPTGSDSNDGLSWANAKRTIQAALDAARPGDQVWVAAGLYNEQISLKENVELYGGFRGTETDLSQRQPFPRPSPDPQATVLDGGGFGPVVTAENLGSGSQRIDGFTIQNGRADNGGGIYCENSSPTISNNTITRNSAEYGGGIYCENSSPTIYNNFIASNSAEKNGGGIYCENSSPTIFNNTITGNSAEYGSGIYCENSSPKISNNTIAGNGAKEGGGIYCQKSSPTIANNIVAFNSSGIYKEGQRTPTLKHNCVYNPGGYNYSGISPGDGDIQVDPRFCALEYGDVHIQPDSPCVDAGDSSFVHPDWVDIDGQPRTQGAGVDIGADESDGKAREFVPFVVRVSGSGDDGNDGSSWSKAKRSVQSAIDAVCAAGGGEVWVAAGTYTEQITLRTFVHVYGGFAGNETRKDQRNWTANTTVLDGNKNGSVVKAEYLGYQTARIDGFTIQNGTAEYGGGICCLESSPIISNNTIAGNNAEIRGGGIYCRDSSPTISNNTITGNDAEEGGGIYCNNGSPTIHKNTITGNHAEYGGGIYCSGGGSPTIQKNIIAGNGAEDGGGIYCSGGSPTIHNNTIVENSSTRAGGIYCSCGSPTIYKNTIAGNYADMIGGGIYCSGGGSPTIQKNTIAGNSTPEDGGGIYCQESSPKISTNTIVENNAGEGGGIYCKESSPNISNNTIVVNRASDGGGIYCNESSPTISSNILAFNSSGIYWEGQSKPILKRNLMLGN